MSSPAGSAPRLEVMDGLRGIAIALVVYFHVWQISWQPASLKLFGLTVSWQDLPEMGFIGVDLFFFISGFVIVYPYVRAHLDGARPPTLGHFVNRRFMKIVPSYLLCIAVLLAVGYARFESAAATVWNVLAHALFVHNLNGDTFGSINGVLWSLGIEVQFYVIFPSIVRAFVRRPYLTAAAMTALALGWRLVVQNAFSAHFGFLLAQLPAVFDVFAAGMLAAWLFVWIRTQRPRWLRYRLRWTAAAIGGWTCFFALLHAGFVMRYEPESFNRWLTADRFPLALAYLAIALGTLFAFPLWQRIVANPALLFLGAISYNLYLWHQVVARYWRDLGPPRPLTADPHGDPAWQFWYTLIVIPVTILVATAITYGFERPLLRAKFADVALRRPPARSSS